MSGVDREQRAKESKGGYEMRGSWAFGVLALHGVKDWLSSP